MDDACYQTTTKDLASREDFFKLRDEAYAIADAYGARNLENAIKPEYSKKQLAKDEIGSDADVENIVDSVMNETKEAKNSAAEEVAEKAEDVKEAVEEKAEEVKEAVEEKAEDVKEAVEDKIDEIKGE